MGQYVQRNYLNGCVLLCQALITEHNKVAARLCKFLPAEWQHGVTVSI